MSNATEIARLTTRRKKIEQSIRETQRIIDKERKYSPEFQNVELIDTYLDHLGRLEDFLADIADAMKEVN